MAKIEQSTDNVTLTREQLQELISAVRPKDPEAPKAISMEEGFESHKRMMEEARKRVQVGWFQAFSSRDTGAKGVAFVTESRRHPRGRVINLPHYEFPAGSDRTRANGGICDMERITDVNGKPTNEYKQWRYSTFWKRDLQSYAGQDARRLDVVGPARPTLEDALADLEEHKQNPPEEISMLPEIVARPSVTP